MDVQHLKTIIDFGSAHSASFAKAYDWAKSAGLRFIIDHQTDHAGYYIPTKKIAAIAGRYTHDLKKAAMILGHEMHHGLQDHQGLYPEKFTGEFAQNYTHLCLLEATAEAFGLLIKKEITQSLQNNQSPFDTEKFLSQEFLNWFNSDLERQWGKRLLSSQNNAAPDNDATARSFQRVEDMLPFGVNFAGGNYLKTMPREVLTKKLLSPRLAFNLHHSLDERDRAAILALRKAQIRKRLQRHAPKPHLPC